MIISCVWGDRLMNNPLPKIDEIFFPVFFQKMLDIIDDCVFVIDHNGKIVLFNDANERLDNLKREQVLGKHLTEVYQLDEHSSISLQVLNTKKPVVDKYQYYVTLAGYQVSAISSAYPILNNANKLIGVIVTTKNITKFKQMLDFHKKLANPGEQCLPTIKQYSFHDIIGESPLIKMSIAIAEKAAQTNSPILVYGETGTGKELFVQSIHNTSNANEPIVSLNCAAVPENLLEGLLFGTARGAFTGAVDQPGLFEEASKGTLFLDELNSMSTNLQSKLLRAVETGRIRRVGETKERVANPRIISALNLPPLEAIDRNLLRKDLFYRLGVIMIKLPALRERKEDLPLLVQHFIQKYNYTFKRNVRQIDNDVLELFKNYHWPGNVRELEHTIEYAMNLIGSDNVIKQIHLPPIILDQINSSDPLEVETLIASSSNHNQNLKSLIASFERTIIENMLEETRGNVSAAAKRLGLNRQSLDYKVKKYGI